MFPTVQEMTEKIFNGKCQVIVTNTLEEAFIPEYPR